MATETPAAPAAPAPASAPSAPAKSPTPPIPAAQAASVSSTPKPNPEVPSAPGFQKSESIESLMKKVAKEAFSKEATDGKELVVTPVEKPKAEPVKAETPPEPKAKVPAEKPKDEAPAAPAPTAETKDRFSDIAPPDGATEVTQKGWKALKDKANAEIAAAEKRLADSQAQLDTFKKATPADQADHERMKAALKDAQDRLAVLDLSAHPDFHRQYLEPKKKALDTAKTLLADNGVENAPDPSDLLGKPRAEFAKAVSEMAAKMPVYDQADFTANMREAYRLQGEEKGALSKAAELRASLQAKAAQQERQAFEESRSEFSTRVPALEIPADASEERAAEIRTYNAAREAAFAEAEKFTFGKATPREVANIATRAAALELVATHVLPMTQRDLKKANALIADLTAELKAINSKKSAPSFSGDQAPAQKDPTKTTFHDAMEEAKRMSAPR